jgi:alpha-amylase/alpha-mannosidase (GH57 family)
MAKLSFLWHLHQPSYRTADRVSHAPWTALHAGGAYRTLAESILSTGGRGQVVNIVPTLLEQLLAYSDATVQDPVIEALMTPAGDLTEAQRELLVSWGFHVTPRQLARYPRLTELARLREISNGRSRLSEAFGPGDLRDLQVLFVIAQAGEQAWRDDRLNILASRGRGFSPTDHRAVTQWLEAQPGELIELWRRVAALPDVEISTSPYAHPIMPLLADTSIVVESWAPNPAPDVPPFKHPDDAAWQLEEGLALMRSAGLAAAGCWPPEGSVSSDVVDIYGAAGVEWLVTDEGILERSLGKPLRDNGAAAAELYRPWRLAGSGPVLFFRDRTLSDAIGFTYGRWDDEAHAARSMVDDLVALGRTLSDDATIVLALDGENPWLHYPDSGGRFLRELMGALGETGNDLEPETLATLAGSARPATLEHLHPGSWINSVFATWIGHPEKTAAWRLLADVRNAIEHAGGPRPPSLLLAEASDWFWWLGDDNPTELAPLYDEIFRRHLADACAQAGVRPPKNIEIPLKTVSRTVRVPVARQWRPPRFDGRVTSYFEWCVATQIETGIDEPVRRLSIWGGADRLYVLIEGDRPMHEVSAEAGLTVQLTPETGPTTTLVIDGDTWSGDNVECAVGRVIELSLPWDIRRRARLDICSGERSALGGAVLLLEPVPVEEWPTSSDEE